MNIAQVFISSNHHIYRILEDFIGLFIHRTKKQAKHLCAQQALSSFVQFRDANDGTFVNAFTSHPMVRTKI